MCENQQLMNLRVASLAMLIQQLQQDALPATPCSGRTEQISSQASDVPIFRSLRTWRSVPRHRRLDAALMTNGFHSTLNDRKNPGQHLGLIAPADTTTLLCNR